MKTLMRNGRDRRSENPSLGHAKKERVSLFGTDQRITSGPAARRPRSKAEYMTAPERFADSQIPLAPRAPSIHDPFPTSPFQSPSIPAAPASVDALGMPLPREGTTAMRLRTACSSRGSRQTVTSPALEDESSVHAGWLPISKRSSREEATGLARLSLGPKHPHRRHWTLIVKWVVVGSKRAKPR